MIATILLALIYLTFIGLGLPDSLLGSAWPSMYRTLNVPMHYAGFIAMIVAAGTVVSSIFNERIVRRFGTGLVVAASVLMTAFSLFCISFSHTFLLMCLFAVTLGLGAGSIDVALNSYVAKHYKARHMNWLHCFWGVGASIGPIIMSSFLIYRNSWHMGYRTIAIIQIGILVLLLASLPLWKGNKPAENTSQRKSIKFKELLKITGVKQVLFIFFSYCTIEVTTGLWGASFLVRSRNVAPEIAAQWIALYYIGITVGRFMSGFVTLKLNNKQMIRLGQAIIGCGIVVLLLPLGNNALLPGLFMIGLGCAPIFPCLVHKTSENFGGEHSQAIVGVQMASAYIGSTTMPPLFGLLASTIGFYVFPIFIGIVLIIKILLTENLNRKVDNKILP